MTIGPSLPYPVDAYAKAAGLVPPARTPVGLPASSGPLRLVGEANPARAQADRVELSGRAQVLPPTPAAEAQTGGLVAGRVAGGVTFAAAPGPGPRADALPFYRHPADLNAAATSINAGRIVDVNA